MLEAVISLKFFSLFSCRQECVHSPFYIRVCTLINSTLVLHQLFFPVNIAPDLFILYHIHKQNLTPQTRKHHLRRHHCRHHCQRGSGRVHRRGMERGPGRETSGAEEERKEGAVEYKAGVQFRKEKEAASLSRWKESCV